MQLLFISEYAIPDIQGGGELNLFSIMKHLVAHNTVHLLTTGDGQTQVKEGIHFFRTIKPSGTPESVGANLSRLFLRKRITRALSEINLDDYDAIHLVGRAVVAAPVLKRLASCPISYTVENYLGLSPTGDMMYRGRELKGRVTFEKTMLSVLGSREIGKVSNSWYLRFNPVFWIVLWFDYLNLRKSILSADKLVLIGAHLKRYLTITNAKKVVIPNFLEEDEFVDLPEGKRDAVLYIGSLTEYKGVRVMMEAMTGLPYKLIICGEGRLRGEIERYAETRNIKVQMKGFVRGKKLEDAYAASGVVVFPPIWPEPFGRIPLQAMSRKLPVLGSNIGAVPETVSPKVGFLYPPHNAARLRVLIEQVLENPTLQKRLGTEGRKRAQRLFSKAVVGKMWESFFSL